MANKSVCMLAAAAAFIAYPAQAQDIPEQHSTPAAPVQSPSPNDVLSDEELGDLRGGESMIITNQTLVAITSGNVINGDYVAGNISLSDFALSNFNGLGNMLINSGAQVSLQTGMNVTINVGD